MEKLLVVTAGTVAAGVGRALQKHLEERESDLLVMVRYIDTARTLPTTYDGMTAEECYIVQINSVQMGLLAGQQEGGDPRIRRFLFDNLPPPKTESAGGGGVRYNGAGAIVMNRQPLEQWLRASMNALAEMDQGQRSFSVVLIASPVGATGSGSLERLHDLIIKVSHTVNLVEEVHCDLFILQPGPKLGARNLANTVALYAEMAASHLSANYKLPRGRTIMVGWGTEYTLSSLPQLHEATATLIRVSTDPRSGIQARFRQEEVNHSVLLENERMTSLPSHLSCATAITITLGDLAKQIIDHDSLRLLGKIATKDSLGKEGQDTLSPVWIRYLSGSNAEQRLAALVGRIATGTQSAALQLTPEMVAGKTPHEQVELLLAELVEARRKLKQNDPIMRDAAATLANELKFNLEEARKALPGTGISLAHISEDYNRLLQVAEQVLEEAQKYVNVPVSEMALDKELNGLRNIRANLAQVQGAFNNTNTSLYNLQVRQMGLHAMAFLRELVSHCHKAINNLDVLVEKVQEELIKNPDWDAPRPSSLDINDSHPYHIPALTPTQIVTYYQDVSIFGGDGNQQRDPFADFRKWLEGREQIEVPFHGEFVPLKSLIKEYTSQRIHQNIKDHSVVNVLMGLKPDGAALRERLEEAAKKAHSLVRFAEPLAENREEERYVSADFTPAQREPLQEMVNTTFRRGECRLLLSHDPHEIVVFYYADGLPMAAVNDLNGLCLSQFFEYHKTYSLQGGKAPLFSGKDSYELVRKHKVIPLIYAARNQDIVSEYTSKEIPELA